MDNPESLGTHRDNAVRESGTDIKGKAEDIKETITAKASDIKETITAKAERATAQLGETIEHASERVRERGQSGRVAGATSAVADRMRRAGTYLQASGFRGLAHDITETVQRHPVQALLIGAGIGYFIGRMTRS